MSRTMPLQPVLLTILLAALVLAVADLFVVTLSILLLIFAGVIFGIFINGVSRWLLRRIPLSYTWSYAAVVAVFIVLVALGFTFLGSQIAEGASQLWSQLQRAAQSISERLNEYSWGKRILSTGSEGQSDTPKTNLLSTAMRGAQWMTWFLTGCLVIFFVGLYLAYDPELYRSGLIRLIPKDWQDQANHVLANVHTVLGYWIIGRLISMAVTGTLTAIVLWILGVPLPVTLGLLAALLTFIPNIGPILAAVPQILLALHVGTNTVLYVILFNIILQTFESYLLTPIVQRYEAQLPPALTICAQLLMAVIAGVIGVIMAAPLAAAAIVLVQTIQSEGYKHASQPGSPGP